MGKDFDKNGDLVIESVPDELVWEIERRAALNGWSVDEELRSLMIEALKADIASD